MALLIPAGPPAQAAFPGVNGKIAFAGGCPGGIEICVMNPDGSGETQLTQGGGDREPAWSPDGRKIAFTSYRDGNGEIYVMNADGTGQTNLTMNGTFLDKEPTWSPDGQKIAFTRWHGFSYAEIYVMNADGSGQTNLTRNNGAFFDQAPAWSPDGQKIAFQRHGDYPDIYVMNADGSGQTRLTQTEFAADTDPAWSPDAQKIAFESGRDGNPEIYVMNRDGTGQMRLTHTVSGENGPAWSPDGQKIAFDLCCPNGRQIYSMNADGTGRIALTQGGTDFGPDWQPAVDTTPPTIQCGTADGVWHASDVSIACTASDDESGLADPNDASFSLSTNVPAGTEDANASTDSRQVCDNAGNCATAEPISGNKIDKKAPQAACGSADGTWHPSDVSIDCTASDGGSGLPHPNAASFSLSTNVPSGTEDANASTDSRPVCDRVGNCATAGPISGNMVDRKAPSISIGAPAPRAYLLNQLVDAYYTCSDGGSGVVSCSGSVPSGSLFDTATVGTKPFTVDAVDAVGNATSSTVDYAVAYDEFLLYDPNKSGNQIKVQLHDASGANMSQPGVVLTVVSIDGSTPVSGTFAYKSNLNGYLYRVDTKGLSSGQHTLEFKAGNDPTVHSVPFSVR